MVLKSQGSCFHTELMEIDGLDQNESITFIVLLSWIGLCMICVICVTVFSCYQLICQDSSSWIKTIYRNLTITIMICFTITNGCEAMWMSQNYLLKQLSDSTMGIILVIKDIFYYSGNVMFYILLLLRIDAPFELNKCIKYSLALIILIYAVTSVIYITMLLILYNSNYHIWRILAIILSVDDLTLNVFILMIFVRKIKKTMSKIDPSISIKAQENINSMVNVAAKHCILFGISIIINQAFTTTVFISTYLADGGLYSFLGDIITTIAVTLEATANVLVLWLILRINYSQYICLCKCCHIFIAKCCFEKVDNEAVIQNPYSQLLIQNDQQSSNPVMKYTLSSTNESINFRSSSNVNTCTSSNVKA